jgi:membrane protease YdiL (CAAX protease family)
MAKPQNALAPAEYDREYLPLRSRFWALLEVLLAFAVVHVAYRSFKHFTEPGCLEGARGLNFSTGTTMIVFTLAMIVIRRRSFAEYGLTWKNWRYNVNLGLLWAVIEGTGGALAVVFAPFRVDPLHPPDLARAMVFSSGYLLLTFFLAAFLMRERRLLARVPATASLVILTGFLSLPVILAFAFERTSVEQAFLSTLWLFFGAGFGEEIFFRGYCQSRINEAFGRPWTLLRVRLGPGLIVSSLLFGFIHALNTVDYFAGQFDFAWLWMLVNFFAGLFLGVLRERTGSILPGALVHGLVDVLGSVPALLPRH